MKKTDKIMLASDQEMGIMELLKSMPDSKSFVFQIGSQAGTYDYYMKLGDPVFTPNDTKYVSVIPVLGLNPGRRQLWFTDFFIPRGRELKALTNKQFLEMLDGAWLVIKSGIPTRDHNKTETLKNFKLLGYE